MSDEYVLGPRHWRAMPPAHRSFPEHADDWPGWGITDALRAVLSAPATQSSAPAGPGPV